MKCEKYQKMISDRLDGELSWRKVKRLDRHLASCPLCRNYLTAQKTIQQEALRIGKADCPQAWWLQFEQVLQEKLGLAAGQPADDLTAKENRAGHNEEKKHKSKNKKWVFRPAVVRASSLVLVVAAAAVFLIIYTRESKKEELPLAMMLSYEESYLNLNQVLGEDEATAGDFINSLEESILEETLSGGNEKTSLELEFDLPLNGYQEEINNLQIEKEDPKEGL
jgi:hypothetical protein